LWSGKNVPARSLSWIQIRNRERRPPAKESSYRGELDAGLMVVRERCPASFHGNFMSWLVSLPRMALPVTPASHPEEKMYDLRGEGMSTTNKTAEEERKIKGEDA
jgi:hypothetical protein